MMENVKLVRFDKYCPRCVRADEDGGENVICNDCLNTPAKPYSHKPIHFEEDTRKKDKK